MEKKRAAIVGKIDENFDSNSSECIFRLNEAKLKYRKKKVDKNRRSYSGVIYLYFKCRVIFFFALIT